MREIQFLPFGFMVIGAALAQAAGLFVVVYWAMRLAIRHEGRRGPT